MEFSKVLLDLERKKRSGEIAKPKYTFPIKSTKKTEKKAVVKPVMPITPTRLTPTQGRTTALPDRKAYQPSTQTGYQQALQGNAGARFHAGVMEGLSPISLGLESEALDGSKAFLAGNVAGTMGQFGIPYAGVAPKLGKALSNIPKYANMGKVGQAVARGVATDLTVGVPLNTLYGVSKEGLEGKELAKSIGLNTAIDLVAGGLFEIIPSVTKGMKRFVNKQTGEVVAEATDEVVEQAVKAVKTPQDIANKPPNRPVQPRNVETGATVPINKQTPVKRAVVETPKTKPDSGNIDTAKGKINYGYSKKSGNLWERVRTQFTDDLAPLEKVEKQVRGKISSAENSLYKQARLSKGIPEKANLIIRNELKPIIKKIEDAGHSYQDLGLYAEAVHARDVNRAGLKSGFTNAEIDDVIRQLGSPEMESARKELVAYSGRRLDSLADAGVIAREEVDAMRKKWKNYMPLNRAFDDDKIEFANGLSKAFVGVSSPIKALKGSGRQIIDPIESLVRNTYKAEQVAGRNIVGRQLTSLAQDDATGAFVRQLAKGEEVGRKNVVNILENGKKVNYEVTPEVYKALKDMNKETSNLLIKAFQTPASILRAGAVLTPEFAVRNPMRDVMQAFINSESGFNPITDFAYGLASYIKRGDLYEAFLKNNAGYGNIISMDRKLHKNTIESMLKKTPTEKVINVVNPQTWLRVLRNISDATESATKIGEFRAALRSGATAQEAAYRARDLMDFARAGSSVRQVNKVVAFLNANIQGKSKLIRSIKRDPVGVGARMVGSMAVPSIGAYYLNNMLATEEQKATIKDAPDWLRDTFWLIAIPGTDTVARIPKPFEGAAVSNVIERFMQYMADNDPEAFDGFLKATVSEQSLPVMLSGLTPIIEGMTNYSFFRQSPIVPEREKYLEKKDQYDIYTSEVAKAVASVSGKVLGEDNNFASPRITDNAIKGITAGLGTYATDAIDAMIGKNKPAKNTEQLPVIKAFTVNPNSTGKAMDFVYTEYDRLNKQKNSAKKNEGTFTQEKNLKILKEAKDQINDISKQIREIQNDPKMSPETKRDEINDLSEKRNKIARDTKAKMSVIPTK